MRTIHWTGPEGAESRDLRLTLGHVEVLKSRHGVCLLTGDDAQWAPLVDTQQLDIALVRRVAADLMTAPPPEGWELRLTPTDEFDLCCAVWGEISDFFQLRPILAARWKPLIEQHLRSWIPEAPGAGSGASAESSAATGGPALSASSSSPTAAPTPPAGTTPSDLRSDSPASPA